MDDGSGIGRRITRPVRCNEENRAAHKYQVLLRLIRKSCASNLRWTLTIESRPSSAAGISRTRRERSRNGLRLEKCATNADIQNAAEL